MIDGNGFFAAVDEFIKGQGKFIFQVFAPDRGLVAASATASALGKGVAAHA